VSRWRASLKHPDRYHERIIRGSFRAAGLIEPEESEYDLPVVPAGRFGTIVVDPPWDMQKIEREVRPNQVGFDYPTMTEAELAAWPIVQDKAADDCHLFCWTTQKFLPVAIRLIEVWDFRYCLTMVWHKPGGFQPIRLPQYNCEFIVYARRGAPVFMDTTNFPCCFSAPRREHSRKPDGFYDIIRRVTSDGRIDVFSRESRDGFAQYGNEVEKFA
jgi:N6-adenosine-specific RNA methylase IME4